MSGLAAAALLPLLGRSGFADAAALSALIRDCVNENAPRQALLVRLGPLASRLRGEHHQRLLREALDPLLRPSRARLFALPNGDLVAVGPERGWHMPHVAERLAQLLGPEAAETAAPLLRLPDQAASLLAAVEESLVEGPPPPPPFALPSRSAARSAARDGAADSAPSAARLAAALAAVDLAAFLRCRPVLRLADDGPEEAPPRHQWTEWRIAEAELCAALLGEGVPLPATLRGVLERRLLIELARPEDVAQRGPIGLSLGLAALESAAFHRLEAQMAPEIRARSVIGLSAEAVLADPTGFLAAREVLAARGWQLALDLADPALAALLPPARTGAALVRLTFDPALVTRGLPPALPPERVVLMGVDRSVALGWGLEAGIRLFEGRLLRG